MTKQATKLKSNEARKANQKAIFGKSKNSQKATSGKGKIAEPKIDVAVVNLQKAGNTFDIPLDKLVLSENNVRKAYTQTALDEIAASLSSVGQIQDLRVRAVDGDKYEVVAGGRRYRGFKLLMSRKQSVKGVKVTKDYPIRATLQLEDDNDTEVSLAENYVRESMHPVDEFKAFAELNKEGKSPEEIADRFGVSHMTVRRRLQLAKVHPELVELCHAGQIDLQQLQALAITDDQELQKYIWDETSEHSRNPSTLKNLIMDEKAHATCSLAQFVGREAYEAKGGTITSDLFGDDDDSYFDNPKLLSQLAIEKMEKLADEHRGQGWKFVEIAFDYNTIHACDYIYKKVMNVSDQDAQTLEKLQSEEEKAEETFYDLPDETEEEVLSDWRKKLDSLRNDIKAIEDKYRTFDPSHMAHAGVIIILSNGEAHVREGMVKPEDKKALAQAKSAENKVEADPQSNDGNQETEPEETGSAYSQALVEDLSILKTTALSVELSNQPDVALCALLHPLVGKAFYANEYGLRSLYSAIEISGNRHTLKLTTVDDDNNGAFTAEAAIFEEWKTKLPEDGKQLWSWLLEQDNDTRLKLLAVVTARQVNALQMRHGFGNHMEHAQQIAEAIDFDMGKWWKPSESFLSRIKKDAGKEILEATSQPKDFIQAVDKMSKKDALPRILDKIKNSGWLPHMFRRTQENPNSENQK